MKKFLIILFALGLISSASASLTLSSSAGTSLNVGEKTNIGIYNDTEKPGAAVELFVIINEADMSKAKWTDRAANMHVPPAPVAGTNDYYGYIADYGDTWYFEPGVSVDPYEVGVFVDYEFECTAEGSVTITMMLGDAETVVDTMTITQIIPEPITVGLLGLGAFFVRRRRLHKA